MTTATDTQGVTTFVIGPIGDRLAPFGDGDRVRYEEAEALWEYTIQPACQAVGLPEPIRADKISTPGDIPEQIFVLLRDADIVIADLTNGNSNVMYELGLRHSRDGKCTIQLGENQRLPFDVNTIRTIRFRRTPLGLAEVRDELIEALKACIEGRGTAVTATRVWKEAPQATAATLATARERAADVASGEPFDEDGGADNEPGEMDILAEGEAAIERIGPTMGRATEAVARMGEIAERMSAEIEQSDARGGGFAGRVRLAEQYGAELQEPTAQLEEAVAEYVELLAAVDPAIDRILTAAEADSEPEIREALVPIIAFAAVTDESMASGAALAQIYGNAGKIARSFRPVTTRIQRALNRMVAASEVVTEWHRRAEALPDWDESAIEAVVRQWKEGSGNGT